VTSLRFIHPQTGPEHEALAMMRVAEALSSDPAADNVSVIHEFACVARVRQLAQQHGWHEDLADIEALYADLAIRVRRIIEEPPCG
jgi:hypothetical protein